MLIPLEGVHVSCSLGQCQHPVEGMGSAGTQWREWAASAPSGGKGQRQHPVEGMGSASTQWREWAVPAPSGGNGQCQHPVEGMSSASRNICYL